MTIPEEVRETVLRRMRLLSREARDVILRASVIGARFEVRVLAATLHRDDDTVRAALEDACRLQITVPHGSDGCWSFRHAVTRDIIYAELAAARLRPLHRRIVRVLEALAADEEPRLHDLAYHSWAAGDARRGVRYNETAGDRAVAIHALDDARLHYGRACRLSAAGSRTSERLGVKLRALDAARGGVPAARE